MTPPGRKPRPLLSTEVGVCGLSPECESTTCPDGGVYRYQQGCRGAVCVIANQAYYENRKFGTEARSVRR